MLHEGYTDRAVIPVKGDVPTIGFGTTTGVKLGDTTTPPKALARALTDVQQFEGALKQCVTVPLAQHEYDALVELLLQRRQPRVLPVHAGQKTQRSRTTRERVPSCCAGASSRVRTARCPPTRGCAAGWLHGEKLNTRQCIGEAS